MLFISFDRGFVAFYRTFSVGWLLLGGQEWMGTPRGIPRGTSHRSSKCQAAAAAGRSGVKSRALPVGQSPDLVQQVSARCKHGCDCGVALAVPGGKPHLKPSPGLGGGFLTGVS